MAPDVAIVGEVRDCEAALLLTLSSRLKASPPSMPVPPAGLPRITEIVAVEDLQTGPDSSAFTVTELFSRDRWDEPLRWTGNLAVGCGRAVEDAGWDLRSLLAASVGGGNPPARTMDLAPGRPRTRPVQAPCRSTTPGCAPKRTD